MNYTLYAWTCLLISFCTPPVVLAQVENAYLSNQQIQATLSDSSELSFDMAA